MVEYFIVQCLCLYIHDSLIGLMQVSASLVSSLSCIPFFLLLLFVLLLNVIVFFNLSFAHEFLMVFDLLHNVQIIHKLCIDNEGVGSMAMHCPACNSVQQSILWLPPQCHFPRWSTQLPFPTAVRKSWRRAALYTSLM